VDLRALAGTLVIASRVEGMWACRANVNHGMCGYRAIKSDIVVPMRCFSCWKTKIMRPSMERGSSLQILGRIPRIRNERDSRRNSPRPKEDVCASLPD
jgi:hypothetical protein